MSFPRFLIVLGATAVVIVTVLLLDAPTLSRQLLLGGGTALFLLWVVRKSSIPWKQLGVALGIAIAGEIFCSLVWGLYEYRIGTIPLYVPVGHLVFYALAFESAEQERIRRFERWIVPGVLAAGSLYAVANLFLARDWWGLLWWWGAASVTVISGRPLMLSLCVVYTVALEFLGTRLGNWTWAPAEPLLGIPQANPPSGVGLGYCMLDFTTMLVIAAIQRRKTAQVGPPPNEGGGRPQVG